jgi:hypothetical protein
MFAYRDSIFFTYFNIGTLLLLLLWIDNWLAFLLAMSHAVWESASESCAEFITAHAVFSHSNDTSFSVAVQYEANLISLQITQFNTCKGWDWNSSWT